MRKSKLWFWLLHKLLEVEKWNGIKSIICEVKNGKIVYVEFSNKENVR